jgi:hypothetical protein
MGIAQNLMRLFTDPIAFLRWLNPTPAAWMLLFGWYMFIEMTLRP